MRNFRGIAVVIAIMPFITAYSFPCAAEVSRLPMEYQTALQDIPGFRDVSSIGQLPPAILALCADRNGKMANPGEAWEATDIIRDESTPTKRLIWAVAKNNLYIVHYERGGRGHSFHFLIAAGEDNRTAQFVWRGVGSAPLKSFDNFVSALKTDQIDDRLDYAH